MHPVHIRRYQQSAQVAVQSDWYRNITMIKHGCGIHDDFKDNDSDNGSADKPNRRNFDTHGQYDLNGMKTNTGTGIEFGITMENL